MQPFRPRLCGARHVGYDAREPAAADASASHRKLDGRDAGRDAHRDRLHLSTPRLRDRHLCGGRPLGPPRPGWDRPRREGRDRQRALPAATAGAHGDDRPGGSGRLRARRPDTGRLDVDVVLLQHEYGIFGGRDGDYVVSLVEELLAAARRDAAHGAVAADGASGEGARGGVPSGRARDRDDGHCAAAPRRRRHLRGRQGSRRAARRADGASGARRRIRVGTRRGGRPQPRPRNTGPTGNGSCSRRSG